jgi:hypothetical protein
MIGSVHRLVYYSRNRMTGTPVELAAAIHDILDASRRNNQYSAVTGALMFNAGCFAQVLEGPSSNLEHVFERIQQDARHGDVSVLSFETANVRAFGNWSMSFAGASVEDAVRYGSLAGESGYDPSRMSSEAIFQTLHRLVLEEETTGRSI